MFIAYTYNSTIISNKNSINYICTISELTWWKIKAKLNELNSIYIFGMFATVTVCF